MDEKKSPAERFQDRTKVLIDYVKYVLEDASFRGAKIVDPGLTGVVKIFLLAFSPDDLVQGFLDRSIPHWDMVKKRDEKFFLDHADNIFAELPKNHIRAVRLLATSRDGTGKRVVTDKQFERIWAEFDVLIKICIRYMHEQEASKPGTYKQHNVHELVKAWNVKLNK